MRKAGGFLGFAVLVLMMIIGIVAIVESVMPNSSKGVTEVAGNTVRLPEGETFVVIHQIGKYITSYYVTFDGDRTVSFECDTLFCNSLPDIILGGIGELRSNDAGWGDHFYATRRADGAVNVEWPYGWTYRPYKE